MKKRARKRKQTKRAKKLKQRNRSVYTHSVLSHQRTLTRQRTKHLTDNNMEPIFVSLPYGGMRKRKLSDMDAWVKIDLIKDNHVMETSFDIDGNCERKFVRLDTTFIVASNSGTGRAEKEGKHKPNKGESGKVTGQMQSDGKMKAENVKSEDVKTRKVRSQKKGKAKEVTGESLRQDVAYYDDISALPWGITFASTKSSCNTASSHSAPETITVCADIHRQSVEIPHGTIGKQLEVATEESNVRVIHVRSNNTVKHHANVCDWSSMPIIRKRKAESKVSLAARHNQFKVTEMPRLSLINFNSNNIDRKINYNNIGIDVAQCITNMVTACAKYEDLTKERAQFENFSQEMEVNLNLNNLAAISANHRDIAAMDMNVENFGVHSGDTVEKTKEVNIIECETDSKISLTEQLNRLQVTETHLALMDVELSEDDVSVDVFACVNDIVTTCVEFEQLIAEPARNDNTSVEMDVANTCNSAIIEVDISDPSNNASVDVDTIDHSNYSSGVIDIPDSYTTDPCTNTSILDDTTNSCNTTGKTQLAPCVNTMSENNNNNLGGLVANDSRGENDDFTLIEEQQQPNENVVDVDNTHFSCPNSCYIM